MSHQSSTEWQMWVIKQVLIIYYLHPHKNFFEIAWSQKVLTPTQIFIFGHGELFASDYEFTTPWHGAEIVTIVNQPITPK